MRLSRMNRSVSLFLQCGREVSNDRNRLVHLLRESLHQQPLAVGREAVERGRQNRPLADQRLRSSEFQRASHLLDRNGENGLVCVKKEKLFAVRAPMRNLAAIGRDLPFPLAAAISLYIDFGLP